MQQQHISYKFSTIWICMSVVVIALFTYKYNSQSLILQDVEQSYDYIIVGAGTSGCVLASKLSENANDTVLLIEAGGEFNFVSNIPLLAVLMQKTKFDWSFESDPQKCSSFGLHNQIQFIPRGKGMGGSNQINYMVHGTDINDDLEIWRSLNINNWSNLEAILNESKQFNTTMSNTELAQILLQASIELNNTDDVRYFNPYNSINNGQRWTTYHSHLKPVMNRENLHVVKDTHVTKLQFRNKHVIAAELVDQNNVTKIISSRKEIILSAGAFNTPQILLLSGIGPSYILNKYNIPLVAEIPGVGFNLHDHFSMPLYVSIKKPISLTMDKILTITELWKYFTSGTGVLSNTPNSGYIRQSDVAVFLFGMGSTDEKIFREIANIKIETFENLFPFHKNKNHEGFVLLSTCLKPQSRGSISLKDTNPFNLVSVNPEYLSNYSDIECTIRAIKLAENVINTNAFKNIDAKIHWPQFENCKQNSEINNEYLECIIRTAALTGYHHGGTCKMGPIEDRLTVVDETLKVKGLTGLRIMDASILPEPLFTYPNSFLTAMAEHLGDLIYNETKFKI